MDKVARIASSVLVYSMLLIGEFSPIQCFADCPVPPEDKTSLKSPGSLDNCGSPTWDFAVDVEGQVFDEGEYQGVGECFGGYTYCDCSAIQMNYIDSRGAYSYDGPQRQDDGTWNVSYHWTITNYTTVQYSSYGRSGACAKTGGKGLAVPQGYSFGADYDYLNEDCDY